jgi:hypothetical protein
MAQRFLEIDSFPHGWRLHSIIIQEPHLLSRNRPILNLTNGSGGNRHPHWLDALVIGVVERSGEQLSANQLLNAIMHSPPIVNALQRAINERAPDGFIVPADAPEFAREIRRAFVEVVENDAAPIDGPASSAA